MLSFQPTRPLRGATASVLLFSACLLISTHAPLAGRDSPRLCYGCSREYFNPRAPCGARLTPSHAEFQSPVFQPTRPLRGATNTHITIDKPLINFNPRAPCGARHRVAAVGGCIMKFQPTRPLRGATATTVVIQLDGKISTHAPLAGRDTNFNQRIGHHRDFNPRAPCGARHHLSPPSQRLRNFNPRAPCGARPVSERSMKNVSPFQPTRPLRGATEIRIGIIPVKKFQPTRPLRGATS